MIRNAYLSSCKVPVEFLEKYSKNTQILNFMKICPVGEEFCTDGVTDERTNSRHDDADIRYNNFANTPKMIVMCRNVAKKAFLLSLHSV
jgi:hypothetical protein